MVKPRIIVTGAPGKTGSVVVSGGNTGVPPCNTARRDVDLLLDLRAK